MTVTPKRTVAHSDAVLVIGEALIDVVRTESVTQEHPGGGPANIALGLGRRDVPVALLTWVSNDPAGNRIASHLTGSGVNIRPESFGAARTSTAVATIGDDGSATYDFDVLWEVPGLVLSEWAAVHTGSLAAFIEPGATAVREPLGTVRARWITFDPNIRPSLIPERDESVAATESFAAVADLMKLSDEDAAWLWPTWSSDQVLNHLLSLGPRVVAMTLGGSGAVLASNTARVRIEAPDVAVVDSIGAGDTFMASLINSAVAFDRAEVDAAALTS